MRKGGLEYSERGLRRARLKVETDLGFLLSLVKVSNCGHLSVSITSAIVAPYYCVDCRQETPQNENP